MLGFGKGKIDLQLEKFNYRPGETIRGKIVLALNKPVKARRLKVRFFGVREGRKTVVIGGGRSADYSNDIVYSFEMNLDGEKEYTGGEYDFEIIVPQDLLTKVDLSGTGALGALMQFVMLMAPRPKWYVEAALDVPMGLDVSKRVQINIG
ncbi:MAG: hypothetical protein N3F05_01415 [Candidatus Diapherotrites archaeon]|nr:hypothetical protein [Candidatus Diapherotrites archaeon]